MTHTYIHKSDMYDPRSNTTTLLKMKNRMERTEEKPSATARAEILLTRMKTLYHTHALSPNQCSSTLVQTIDAPLPVVWSVLRRFGDPQGYKLLVKTCSVVAGDGVAAGSVRELTVVSGMPAERSTERLDRLDDERHVMAYSIIGGDHKLVNYSATTTVHEDGGCEGRTVVMESYVVDIPADSCEEDTCLFADTIIGYNLKSLAKITEKK